MARHLFTTLYRDFNLENYPYNIGYLDPGGMDFGDVYRVLQGLTHFKDPDPKLKPEQARLFKGMRS